MDIYEQAAFYTELCSRGVAIYESAPDVDEDFPITIKKTPTTADERIYLDEEHDEYEASGQDEAVEFLKAYIGWIWKTDDDEPDDSPVELIRFDTFMLFDAGIGPQQRELGKVSISADAVEDWQEQVEALATELAQTYVDKEYPGKKLSDIKAQIKYQPSR